jgi:hypothetical protein
MTALHATESTIQRIQAALRARNFALLEPALSDEVQFASCVGRAQVIEHLGRMFSGGLEIDFAEIERHPDRLIVALRLGSPEGEARFGPQQFAVLFVRNGVIVELRVTEDRAEALEAPASPPPQPRPATGTHVNRFAAVLPVRDLAKALEHYARLGFATRAYSGGGYGYAERDQLNLHLAEVADLNPATTTSAVYLYVDDADSLYAEWRSAGVSGQFFEPHDTDYGLREGAHIDRDGNLIRFGSPLP